MVLGAGESTNSVLATVATGNFSAVQAIAVAWNDTLTVSGREVVPAAGTAAAVGAGVRCDDDAGDAVALVASTGFSSLATPTSAIGVVASKEAAGT